MSARSRRTRQPSGDITEVTFSTPTSSRGGGRSPAGSRGVQAASSTPRGVTASSTAPPAAATTGTINLDTITLHSMSPPKIVETPEVVQEEVVLNARGMPARQRKKNRFYYDEETMVTPETLKAMKAANKGRTPVKHEPIETEEIEVETMDPFNVGDDFTTDLQPPPPPAAVTPVPKVAASTKPGRGRPRNDSFRYQNQSTIEIPASSSSPERKAGKARVSGAGLVAAAVARDARAVKQAVTARSRRPAQFGEEEDNDEEYTPTSGPGRKSTKSLGGTSSTKRDSAAPVKEKKTPSSPVKLKRERDSDAIVASISQSEINREAIYREKDRLDKQRDLEGLMGHGRRQSRGSNVLEYDSSGILIGTSRQRRQSTPQKMDLTLLGQDSGGSGTIPSTTTEPRPTLDRKTAHDISIRLRNLLKLPKAHKWVCYEWFYSNIDKVLFEGENDFQICLKESFPQLKVRKMTRVEWCKVRRLMGKPRRCSQSFFDEEREELARRRQKIRMIQQRKMTDFNYKELPDEIPLQLVIGTKVTSRLRKPQDGLFTGTIDGVDTSNNTYRITFDRPGLGTHSIPDFEVLSNDPPETVSTSSFALKLPRRTFGSGFKLGEFDHLGWKSPFPVDGMLGGFPIRLLDMIVRLSKLLKAKREKILQLKELNVEAEKMRSYGKRINDDYRIRYARCICDLESMNKEMAMYLEGIQQYCLEIAPDHGANQMIIPEHVQETCKQEASLVVDTYNTKQNRSLVHGTKGLTLIASMTSLLLQVKALAAGDRNLYELKSIKDTLAETKATLEGRNIQLFQDLVEIPMNRIQAGLTMTSSANIAHVQSHRMSSL